MCVDINKISYQIRCFFWHVAPNGSHGPVEDAGFLSRTLIEYCPRLLLRSDFVKKGRIISSNVELLVISINQAISFIDNVISDLNLKI